MQLKDNAVLPLSLQVADKYGNPTTDGFDAPPAWISSDDSVVALSASDDGLSASAQSPAGKLGSATIQVSGLVAGQAVLGSLQLDIIAGDVAEIVIVPGAPVPQA